MNADTTVTESANVGSRLSTRVRWARYGYVLFAGIFVVCVLIQVYIAGMAVFIDPANWDLHTTFIHVFELIPAILLVLALLGKLSYILKLLPIVLFSLILVQYAIAHRFGSLVGAIHPVNALVIFWIGIITTRMAWRTLSEQTDTV
jgi:hypothetical protein